MKFLFIVFMSLMCFNIYAQPSDSFNLTHDGWTANGDGCPAPANTWNGIVGNPGGCFVGTDNSNGVWYYYSSTEFNGDMSIYYGHSLNFDLKQNTATFQTNNSDIFIVNTSGNRIAYNTAFNPGTSWTTYSIMLTEVGWRYNDIYGLPVTYSDFISYLSDIQNIRIRGDYSNIHTETTWLDNVNISLIGALPIILNNFNGIQYDQNSSKLNWETLSEIDCDYFQIEKSLNGGLSFDSLSCLDATGSNNITSKYEFYDHLFYEPALYRLKSVDLDLSVTYSDAIYINNEFNNAVKLYPNPTRNKLQVVNTGPCEAIRIIDCYDRVVFIQAVDIHDSVELELESLSSGTYYLSIIHDNNVNTFTFQIIK